MRQHRLAPVVLPGAQNQRRDQGRHTGVDVHHSAAGEVEHAASHEPAAAPDPVGHGGVDKQGPKGDKDDVRPEPHPLDHGARDERGGDDGEGGLVGHEEHVRNGALGLGAYPIESEVGQAAEQRAALAKGEAVRRNGPGYPDDAQRHEAHHHGVERVLVAHQATVKEGERGGHEQDQRGRDQHPGRIGRNDGRRRCGVLHGEQQG